MKWIETNGLLVLEHGAHERVPSGIPEAVLRMGVVGGSEGGLASSPLRSQSALIPSLKPMATGDSDNRWSMPRAAARPRPWLSQRLDPRGGEGQGPTGWHRVVRSLRVLTHRLRPVPRFYCGGGGRSGTRARRLSQRSLGQRPSSPAIA